MADAASSEAPVSKDDFSRSVLRRQQIAGRIVELVGLRTFERWMTAKSGPAQLVYARAEFLPAPETAPILVAVRAALARDAVHCAQRRLTRPGHVPGRFEYIVERRTACAPSPQYVARAVPDPAE